MMPTPTLVPTMPARICEDLVPSILAANETQWWPADLRNLALVSRSTWLASARKRLYQCPVVHTFKACQLLARTLQGNADLISLLHGIDLRPLGDGTGTATQIASLHFLLATQHAYKLVLAGELAFKAERFLQVLSAPHMVVELNIDGHMIEWKHESCCHRYATLRWDTAVASAFPHLRKLRLCHVEVDIATPHKLSPIRPQEVILERIQLNGPVESLVDFCDVRTLRIAVECGSGFNQHLAPILTSCAETIESLEYEVEHGWQEDSGFPNLPLNFPRLLHFALRGVPLADEELYLISQQCRAITTLEVSGRWSQLTSAEWVTFISSESLAKLQYLRTPDGTFHRPWSRWTKDMRAEIQAASAFRNIELL